MSATSAKQLVPHHRLVTISVLISATMQTLDTTIANVALPHIQGSLAATQEQMSWVLTSYIIATAVMTPLSAWIANRIGRKQFLLITIVAFTAMSVLCGLAQNLTEMVVFRLLQGLSGAALVPLSQATMLDINPPERHARAMALFITGVTIGPIFGAPLGAWLTEYLGWRWVFFINVPMGIVCFIGLAGSLRESTIVRRPFDFFGFTTLSIATLTLQLMLDRGQLKDWFSSPEIWMEATCAGLAAYLFIIHSCTAREPFINLRLFENRNYNVSCALGLVLGALMLGPLVLLTTLLQGLLQYPVLLAGMIGIGRAIGMVAAMAVLSKLLRIFETRLLIATGFALVGFAALQMSGFSLQMHYDIVFWTGVLYGFGVGIASAPMTTLAFATLPAQLRTEASAFSNLIRNMGGSAGIAIMQTLFVRSSIVMHARLVEHVTPYGNEMAGEQNLSSTAALAAMDGRVVQQAAMLAYNNMFKLMGMMALCSIPFVLLFRKPEPLRDVVVAARETNV